jgi:hypothetical protein
MAIPPLVLRIYADSTGMRAGMSAAAAQTKAVEAQTVKSSSRMSQAWKNNAGLMKLAIAGAVVAVGVKSVQAFNEAQAAIAQTNAVLKSTQGVAGVTASEVTALSTEMQQLTTYSDEEVRSAQNLLLTFTKISGDVFPDTTKVILDMSTALGQDLKSSTIQVGKAMQDPIKGITALRRVGVNFNQVQQDIISSLVEEGKLFEAQQMILKELKTEFGGSAQAAAKTFGGQMKQLGNEVNDLMEVLGELIVILGKALLPVIRVVVEELAAWAKMIRDVTTWLDDQIPSTEKNATTLLKLRDAYLAGEISAAQFQDVLVKFGRMSGWDPSQIQATVTAMGAVPTITGKGRAAYHQLGEAVEGTGKKIRTFLGMTRQSQRAWAAEMMGGFDGVKAAFDSLGEKAVLTATKVIREFRRQARNLREYNQNLQVVADRNIPSKILADLIAMGMGGADIMALLANAGKREFARIVDAMRGVPRQENAVRGTLARIRSEAERTAGDYSINFHITRTGTSVDFRQAGGPVSASRPYIVGERGPELFVPNTSGKIVAHGTGKSAVGGKGDIRISIDRRRWVREADYEAAYGGA